MGRDLSRPFFLLGRWSTGVVLVLSAVFGFSALGWMLMPEAGRGDFDNRTLISISALSFAVFSFFLRSLQIENQSRKQHTIKVLFDTRLSTEFREMLELRREHFPIKSVIDPVRYRGFLEARRSKALSEEEATSRRKSAEALRSLLNYYEFVAFGIQMRDLDKTLLKGTVRAIMCNLVQDARYVIADSQAESASHYEHLAALYDEWREGRFAPIPEPGTPLPQAETEAETASATPSTT